MSSSTAKHTLMGGKLHVYRRKSSGPWQCSTYLAGKNHRVSTKTDSLAHAKDFAQGWYLELHGKHRRGEVKLEKALKTAAAPHTRYGARSGACFASGTATARLHHVQGHDRQSRKEKTRAHREAWLALIYLSSLSELEVTLSELNNIATAATTGPIEPVIARTTATAL